MVDIGKLKEEQLKLAKKVILKDSFDSINLIAGADQAFHNDNVISAIVACDYRTMEVKEKVFAVVKAKVPYISGFMAYREGPAISEAYAKLQNHPDVMLINGNGILHPRKCGMASHIGILLDQAAVGIAKQLLLGEVKNNKVYVGNEIRAELIVTREHAKPIYVSPGHKITLKTSVEIVKNCIKFPHKLPEPLHFAHRYANEIKEKIEKGEIKV
jgi:deoxyribonuclease V